MSFNIGYFIAFKTSGTGGGVLNIEHIDGSVASAQRGLPQRGQSIGLGTLPIFNPHSPSSTIHYPLTTKFSNRGLAILQFLYDFSAIPHTVAGPSGILATPCQYSIGAVPRYNSMIRQGLLLHFSNVGDFSNASPHFSTPSLPIRSIQSYIDEATTMARRLSAISNPLSRHTMAGIVMV